MSPCHKFWFSNPYIFWPLCCKPLIFQTYIIWSNRSHSLKCQMSTKLDYKDMGIRKSEFVTFRNIYCVINKETFYSTKRGTSSMLLVTINVSLKNWYIPYSSCMYEVLLFVVNPVVFCPSTLIFHTMNFCGDF